MKQLFPEKKLLGLEVVRFISAFAVLVYHYQHFFYVKYSLENFQSDKLPFYTALNVLYQYGSLGVQVFWSISGFIFFWKYQEVICHKIIGWKKFFTLRFSRLYPLHIATLLLVAGLQITYFKWYEFFFVYRNNDIKHFILQLFLASNWGAQGFSFNGPIWSISVEVLVYVFFFLVLRFIGSSTFITLAVLLICGIIKFNNLTQSPIVDCIVYFYFGGLTSQIFKRFEGTKYQKFILIFCLILILCPFIFLNENIFNLIKYVFLMLYSSALIYIVAVDIKFPLLAAKFIEALGNMTYSSYLIHFPLQLLIVLIFGAIGVDLPLYSPYFFILFLLLTLILAHIIYEYFEKPLQYYIRKVAK
jgi:peptidoglycan/LPS O-acetylase OafA/YrhL